MQLRQNETPKISSCEYSMPEHGDARGALEWEDCNFRRTFQPDASEMGPFAWVRSTC